MSKIKSKALTFNNLQNYFNKYITDSYQIEFIKKSFKYAKKKHKLQKRVSGDPYFLHLYEVAVTLAKLNVGYKTISAGLLHDIIEDQNVSYEELKKEFDEDVAFLVKSVTKLNIFFKENKNIINYDANIKNLIIGMSKDIRVILIKLADRLHNIRTLSFLSSDKQQRIAKETISIFAPIAHRLGLANLTNELYDLCFLYLKSDVYNSIKSEYEKILKHDDGNIREIISIIKNILHLKNIKFISINGRKKSIWSIYNKMIRKNIALKDFYDLNAIRIILDDDVNCYEVLGIIHEKFTPIRDRFRDYIAVPKPNLYQSLHTVINLNNQIVEIQIRTEKMNKYINSGIVAHWRYKEKENKNYKIHYELSNIEDKLNLLSDLKNIYLIDEENPKVINYVEKLNKEIFYDYVYVLTPKKETIILEYGSTVLDFAFKIHTKLPFYVKIAKVNGKSVPLEYTLKTGDVITLIKSKNANTNANLINKVHNNKNKVKIKKFIRAQKYKEKRYNIENGKKIVHKFLTNEKISLSSFDKKIDSLIKYCSEYVNSEIKNLNDFYILISEQKLFINKIYNDFLNFINKKQNVKSPDKNYIKQRKNLKDDVLFDGIELNYKLSSCCSPIYNEEIIGYITKNGYVNVHYNKCKNILNIQNKDEKNQKIINANWNENHNDNNKYEVKFVILSNYSYYTFKKINEILINMHVPIKKVTIKEIGQNNFMKISAVLIFKDIIETNKIMTMIERLPETIKILRQ